MKLSSTEKTIVNGMARAFFVSAWADKQERKGRSFAGQELMDVAPSTPRYARDFALMFAGGLPSLLVSLNNAAWADVIMEHPEARIETAETRPGWGLIRYALNGYRWGHPELEAEVEAMKTDEYVRDFGHCLAMMGLGTGVSWFDNHARFDINVPLVEAYL